MKQVGFSRNINSYINMSMQILSINPVKNGFWRNQIAMLLICLLFGLTVKSQVPSLPKSAVSPNAASLGLYGEVPVSLYTGTPSIDIPIDEIKCGNVTLPISLSYHCAGIRPDQHPGWTGMGWTLQAGGMISRVVRGLPDDHKSGAGNRLENDRWVKTYNKGYYYSSVENLLRDDIHSLINSPTYEIIDMEPDEFSFNIPGYSGKFFLNNQGNWVVQCDKPLKVEYTGNSTYSWNGSSYNSCIPEGDSQTRRELKSSVPNFNINGDAPTSSTHFTEFTITDEYGNKYVFGDRYANIDYDKGLIEYSIDFFKQGYVSLVAKPNQGWHSTSWMLHKIIATNGKEIIFSYERGPFVNQLNQSILKRMMATQGVGHTDGFKVTIGGFLISPVYLSQITGPDSKIIRFENSSSKELRYDLLKYKSYNGLNVTDMTLDQDVASRYTGCSYINFFLYLRSKQYPLAERKIYNTDDLEVQLQNLEWRKLDKIKIYYTYDNDMCRTVNFTYSNDDQKRLTLEKIDIYKGKSAEKQQYVFDYYHLDKLPPYLSQQVDHWGFANDNQRKFISDVPYELGSLPPSEYTSSRAPSIVPDVITAGALQKITYPTGGTTVFEYEQHQYGKTLGEIKWDKEDIQTVNGRAGGLRIQKITSKPDLLNPSRDITKKYLYEDNGKSYGVIGGVPNYQFADLSYSISGTRAVNLTFSSQSVQPISENSSGSHIGYTKVKEKISGSGYTEYTFSNFDNGYMDEAADETVADYKYEICSSKAQERGKVLNKKVYDNSGVLVAETKMGYERYNGHNHGEVSTMRMNMEWFESNTSIFNPDSNFCYQPSFAFISGVHLKIQTHSLLLTSMREYFYPAKAKITLFGYNHHMLIDQQLEIDSLNGWTEGQVKMCPLVETRYTYPFFLAFNSEPTVEQKSVWLNMTQNNFLNYPVEIIKRIGIYTGSFFTNDGKIIEGTYLNYKPKLNLVDFRIGYYKDQKVVNDFLVDKTYELSINSPLNDSDFSYLSLNNNVFDRRYKLRNEFKYNFNSKIIEVHKNDGVITYLWDNYNYYPFAVIKNVGYEELKNALHLTDNQILSLGVSRDDLKAVIKANFPNRPVLINSYEFNLLKDIKKITDPRGVFKDFNYDSANRLSSISDMGKRIIKEFEYNYGNQPTN